MGKTDCASIIYESMLCTNCWYRKDEWLADVACCERAELAARQVCTMRLLLLLRAIASKRESVRRREAAAACRCLASSHVCARILANIAFVKTMPVIGFSKGLSSQYE